MLILYWDQKWIVAIQFSVNYPDLILGPKGDSFQTILGKIILIIYWDQKWIISKQFLVKVHTSGI